MANILQNVTNLINYVSAKFYREGLKVDKVIA